MNGYAYLAVIAIGLGLGALALRNIEKYSGKALLTYVASIVVIGGLGALIAHDLGDGYHWPVGLTVGMGLVELAPTLGTALKSETKKRLGKVFDRFSKEKEPGYSGDHE
jgi:hypothetical protein